MFDGVFDVLRWRKIGERHLKLELAPSAPGVGKIRLDAIHFSGWAGAAPPPRVRIAYRLAPDDYRGGEAIQLVIVHLEPALDGGNC